MKQWLVIPGFQELYGDINLAVLVIGLQLIELHGRRLGPKKYNRPLASGGLLLGRPSYWIRATWLLERRCFLVEIGGLSGPPLHSTVPVTFEMLSTYLITWFYTDVARGIDFVEYAAYSADEGADLFWSQAYRQLLGLPEPPAPPEPPKTIEELRWEGMVRAAQQSKLLPEIARLESKLSVHLYGKTRKRSRKSTRRNP